MEVAMIFEKFYALWFLIIGISLLTASREWKKLLTSWMKNPEQLKVFAISMLPLGLFTILLHNIWSGTGIIVTLIGWIMSLELAVFMCYPRLFYAVANKILHMKKIFLFSSIFYILLGVIILVSSLL